MPQTKFVLKKAIQAGHKIIVVINKIDKPDARCEWVLNKTFDLFIELGATDEQADFPLIYAAGALGKTGIENNLSGMTDVKPLVETIITHIPKPIADPTASLQMLTVSLAYDNYKGKIAIGRIYAGTIKKNREVAHINRDGVLKKATITNVMSFEGMQRVDVDEAVAGDIVAVSGIADISIGETIADLSNPVALPTIAIEEPTVKMNFSVNNSPFAGREGSQVTSRNIAERLQKELETDVALRVENTQATDTWTVSGRGELHLAILIEKMRREGFELQVSRPQVIMKEQEGKKVEPIERVVIEVPEASIGSVIEDLGKRRGTMVDMRVENNTGFLEFLVPTRGLIGYRSQFTTNTKGQGIMNTLFEGYEPFKGEFESAPHGSLVASESGTTRTYGLLAAEERGVLFVGPGVEVYEGMVVGENAKAMDLRVNVCREKQLSNMRAKSDGGMEFLKVPRSATLEDAIEYIGDDELVEVTPESIRIRKIYLKESDRRK
jgi:GTP-binding protein